MVITRKQRLARVGILLGMMATCFLPGVVGDGATDRATASTNTTGNPWNWTMTNPSKDGMTVKGVHNSLNQIFTVKDPYGAPIVSVGHVGGLSVFGDQIRVFAPNTLDNPVAVIGFDGRISLSGPNSGVYVDGALLTKRDIEWIHDHE